MAEEATASPVVQSRKPLTRRATSERTPSLIERCIVVLCRIVLWVSTSIIFGILVVNTILRYATGTSLQWANELPELLFPWLVMSGVVLAAAQGAHIATTFLMEAIRPAWRRLVAVAGWLLVACLYFTLAWATFRMLDIVHDEKSQILQVPGSVTYACLAGGMVLLALLALQSAREALRAQPAPASEGEPHVPVAHW